MKELIVELDGYCPNNCLHCSSASTSTISHISLIDYQKLIEATLKHDFHNAVFSSGEPRIIASA